MLLSLLRSAPTAQTQFSYRTSGAWKLLTFYRWTSGAWKLLVFSVRVSGNWK
jgi:hypothetical protein